MTALRDPLHLRRGRALPNRLALAPMTNLQSHADGTISDMEIAWLEARANGGFGLTMTAAAYVNRAGQAWPHQLGISDDMHTAGLSRLARVVAEAGSVSSVQLHHGGLKASSAASGLGLVGAWADPSIGMRALTKDEVQQSVDDFAAAAARAERAGIDGVEVHGAHGYLVGQFLDVVHNQRGDGYGGDAVGRARFVHEVIRAIRDRTGENFQLGVRLSPERFGVDTEETVALVRDLLACELLDYIDLSLWDIAKLPADAPEGSPMLIDRFLQLPRCGTALGVAGRISGAPSAQWALDRGADLAFIGKGAIADHGFAQAALADIHYEAPAFPVTKQHLLDERLGEPFVEYFATNWPHLVSPQ